MTEEQEIFLCKDIPFTPWWVEIDICGGWVDFAIKELYVPDLEAQKVLGSSDSHSVFELGFRLPWCDRVCKRKLKIEFVYNEPKYRMFGYDSTMYDCVVYEAFGLWYFTFGWHWD